MRRLFLAAALALAALAGPARAQDYRVQIQQVDSTNFPEIELRFQVFIQRTGAPPWDWRNPVQVHEWVVPKVGQTLDAEVAPEDIGEVEICDEKPVIMAVAIDVSGSVASVLTDIRSGVEALFQQMDVYASQRVDGKRDWGAVLAFDSGTHLRFPDDQLPVDQHFSDRLAELSQTVQAISGGGASPIWVNLQEELDRLLAYRPELSEHKRVMAALTDGQNNQQEEKRDSLLASAQLGGAQLFTLGYGSVNAPDLQLIANASGGAFVPNAEDDFARSLIDLLNAARTTYCVKYQSPFGDKVNEPAFTQVTESGSAADLAAYPLPFLIPEDTPDATLFFPTTEWFYQMVTGNGTQPPPAVKARFDLRTGDEPPVDWVAPEGTPDRADVTKDFEWDTPGIIQWVYEPDPDDPLVARIGFEIPVPPQLLTIPTDFVDMHRELQPGEQLISQVSHFIVTAELNYDAASGQERAGRQYPSATRLSVQDRTPPNLFLRLRPQDGGPVMELTLREGETMNQDPGLVRRYQLTKEAGLALGHGDKRAELAYTWRDEEGREVTGTVQDQLWSNTPEDGSAPPSAGPDHADVVAVGVHVREGTRMAVQVLARDNYARVPESTAPEDLEVWAVGQTYTSGGPPISAQLDRNRVEAQPGDLRAPFLEVQARQALEDDRALAGVAWWIEPNYEDPDRRIRDPGSDPESLPVLRFRYSDEELQELLVEEGLGAPPDGEPLRWFMVRAQDGQGNPTLVRLPLYVGDVRFDPQLVDWKRRRQEGL